jgi:hypothetical protein
MVSGPAFRCDDCRDTHARCAACRERRADARRAQRAERRERGVCSECGRKCVVVDGVKLTRCKIHREDNRVRSLKSHTRPKP